MSSRHISDADLSTPGSVGALVKRMIALGCNPDIIALVVDYVSANVRRQSADASADARRKRDADRKRAKRKLLKDQSFVGNGAGGKPAPDVRAASADASADAAKNPESILKVDSINETQKGRSKRLRKEESECARARGERMIEGAVLTDRLREVAIAAGLEPGRCDETWREFVDYWCAIPGKSGLKSNWVATWRNRVHKVVANGSYRNGHRRQSIAEQAADYARELRAEESARAAGNADDLFRRG